MLRDDGSRQRKPWQGPARSRGPERLWSTLQKLSRPSPRWISSVVRAWSWFQPSRRCRIPCLRYPAPCRYPRSGASPNRRGSESVAAGRGQLSAREAGVYRKRRGSRFDESMEHWRHPPWDDGAIEGVHIDGPLSANDDARVLGHEVGHRPYRPSASRQSAVGLSACLKKATKK